MQISTQLSKDEIATQLQGFYKYFKTGYDFEEFLKDYLQAIGLEEVEVTQRSKDHGIDLKATRKGVGDLSNADITQYLIQAKRYKPNTPISVAQIRQLKGVLLSGQKGIFITTAYFSKQAIEEAENDNTRPIILIDGEKLITSCIDHEIGFIYHPTFSKDALDKFLHKASNESKEKETANTVTNNAIQKEITANDIRAHIISIPTSIMQVLNQNKIDKINVTVNGENTYSDITINRPRNYLGGVTKILRTYGCITIDGVVTPKMCSWEYDIKQGLKLNIDE